jgi:hypothetical protein
LAQQSFGFASAAHGNQLSVLQQPKVSQQAQPDGMIGIGDHLYGARRAT